MANWDKTDIQARAARGAVKCDEHQPDWWQRIDVDRLNMASCTLCIIGQSFQTMNYATIIEDRMCLNIAKDEDFNFGFDWKRGEGNQVGEILREAWIAEIEKRQRKAEAHVGI